MKQNNNWYKLNNLYSINDISTDKHSTLHTLLWNNAVNRYFNENGLNKTDYRCSEQIINSDWYEPSYLFIISREPVLKIISSEVVSYHYSYMYDEENPIIGDSTTFISSTKITPDKHVTDNKTYITYDDNGSYTYSYTYIIDRENTYSYSFDRNKIYLEQYWNNQFILDNIPSDIDLTIKYNLDNEDDIHIYEVSDLDYINGKVIISDKLSNKKLKVNFNENIEKILNI